MKKCNVSGHPLDPPASARRRTTKKTPVKPSLLEKRLGLWDVYALATGATFSSGFFLLPGIAAARAGPAMPLSYLLGR